jgi:CheY-like chemotaxis protein
VQGKPVEVISSMADLILSASIRLLIVDDHAVVRAGFSSVLRRQVGLEVVGSVQSGEDALTFLKRCPVDVLLLDLHMPGMSGIDTLLALQELPCPPHVIVLSSFEPNEEICRAVVTGAKGYLRKDISCTEITLSISPMAGLPSSPFDPSLCRFKQEFWALIFLYSGGPLVMNGCRLRNCAWQIQGSAAITPESLTTCGWHIIPHDYAASVKTVC